MSSYSNQPVRAFPMQSHYAASYASPEKSLARGTEQGLREMDRQAKDQTTKQYQGGQASQRGAGIPLADADDLSTRYESTRSGRSRPVPSLPVNNVPQNGATIRGISRNGGAAPVGPTSVPDTNYRPPSGTTLNKIPYSARQRIDLAEQQRATQERLRAKALDRKLRDAVIAQDLQAQSRPNSRQQQRPRSASAKKATKVAQRHAAQQQQQTQAYLSQDEISALTRPYQPQQQLRPASAGPSGAARPPTKQTNWGRQYEPADRPGQLISSSVQSRLTPQELAEQKTAGRPSNGGANLVGNDLATILGGGHENVIFGNRNAPSAQTRQKVNAEPPAPRQQPSPAQVNYAPFATTIESESERAGTAPSKFNDPSGAVMIRDDLTREVRHASASIGFGKSHAGYRDYVARPAAASSMARAEQQVTTINPFQGNKNTGILTWDTGSYDRATRGEDLKRQQQEVWSRTSGDYGTKNPADDTNRNRPVAGKHVQPDPTFRLGYDEVGAPTGGRHAPAKRDSYGSAIATGSPVQAKTTAAGNKTAGPLVATQASSNPLNPMTAEELAALTRRQPQFGASALGYGKSHPAYKTQILAACAVVP